ncbi:hypothetical protein PMAYCL1PPCAC_20280, partial [Pristionchus mayeri]
SNQLLAFASLVSFYIGLIIHTSSNEEPAILIWAKSKRTYIFVNWKRGISLPLIVGITAALMFACAIVIMIVQLIVELKNG